MDRLTVCAFEDYEVVSVSAQALNCPMKGTTMKRQCPLLWAIVAMDPSLSLDAPLGGRTGTRHQLGRALAQHLLAQGTLGPWSIETTEGGKPIAVGEVEKYISISHTGSYVAAAMSAIGPVGIDIERRDRTRDFVGLAASAFGRAEAAAVAIEGASAFYRIWTLREAISKATGEGLLAVVDRIDRIPPKMADGVWIVTQGGWLMAHDVLEEGVSLAMAVRSRSNDATAAMQATEIAHSRVKVERQEALLLG